MYDLLKRTFSGKKVFLTGHTGFKGSWLLQILHHLGAEVKGFSLAPENENDLYNQIEGDGLCYASVIGDINEANLVKGELVRFEPDFVFHLAAQALVKKGYDHPIETFNTNVMGTIHVLDAMRFLNNPCVGIMVTTDKVYENKELGLPFKEDEKLGGHDPYSASKAACEIAIASYYLSYFHNDTYDKHHKAIASLRAGNVIGGGDYAHDRIIPDIVRAIAFDDAVKLRNPKAVRPWQHVIEPLFAYLLVAAKLQEDPKGLSLSYNIGPESSDILEVQQVTEMFIEAFGHGRYEVGHELQKKHEAQLLLLDNAKIKAEIGFSPKLNAPQAIAWTAQWYADKENSARDKCAAQINAYKQLL